MSAGLGFGVIVAAVEVEGAVEVEEGVRGRGATASKMLVKVLERGMEAERRARRAEWRRGGRRGRVVVVEEEDDCALSSAGVPVICSVIWISVRGRCCVRMMWRRVLCSRVSRWRSLTPGICRAR